MQENTNIKEERGFTLVELLIVAGIIAVLAILALIALNSARQMARDSKRLSDIKQTQAALELYFNDNNSYPVISTPTALGILGRTDCLGSGTQGFETACDPDSATVYMTRVFSPLDRGLNALSSCSDLNNAYCYSGNETTYRIQFELERSVNGTDILEGVNCATPNGIEAGECFQP